MKNYLTISILLLFYSNSYSQIFNDFCSSATEVFCGDFIDSSTIGATPDPPFSNQCGFPLEGPGIWYKVTGTGGNIVIRINSENAITFHVYGVECDPSNCIIDSNDASGVDFIIESELNVIYYILVGSILKNVEGDFNLSIGCAENDLCEDAIDITCGDEIVTDMLGATIDDTRECRGIGLSDQTIWYRIIGTGELYEFSLTTPPYHRIDINIMNNQCGEFDQFTECPFFFNDLLIDATFFAVENEEYLIALSTESFQPPLSGNANISIRCKEPPNNNDCQTPDFVNCGQTIKGDLSIASQTDRRKDCWQYFTRLGIRDLWYEIEGNGESLMFENTFIENENVLLRIIDPNCSLGSSECVLEEFIYGQHNIGVIDLFQTEDNKGYLIQVSNYSLENLFGEFEIRISCSSRNEIPTLNEWSLIILFLLFFIFPITYMKQGNVKMAYDHY